MIQIGVAAYSGEPSSDLLEASNRFIEEISKLDSSKNIVFILGGYWGLMRHVSSKACREGFRSIFILPEEPREVPPDNDCYISIYTGLDFRQRSEIIVLSSKVLAVLGGSIGTIIEAFMSVAANKPIYILSGYNLPSDSIDHVLGSLKGFVDFRYKIYYKDPISMARDLYRDLNKG